MGEQRHSCAQGRSGGGFAGLVLQALGH